MLVFGAQGELDGDGVGLEPVDHLGLQVMLAGEGAFMGGIGVLWGLGLGLVLSVVLVHVVNRQSFHWTLGYRVPVGTLAIVAVALVASAALTAALRG